jgi:hypothetical protein
MVCIRYITVNTLHKGDNNKSDDDNHEQLTITLYHDGVLSGNLLRVNCGGKEGLARPDLLLPPEPLPPLLPPPV